MAVDGWSQSPAPAAQPPFGSPPNTPFAAPPPGGPGARGPTNSKAIASLVLGIVGCCTVWIYGLGIILGIVGLVLGIIANKEIKASGQAGSGMAVAGIVLGSIAIAAGILLLAFAGVVFNSFRACFEDPESAECKELTGEESTHRPVWGLALAPLAARLPSTASRSAWARTAWCAP